MSFHYQSTDGHIFRKNLECRQCNGRTLKNHRCHNRTCAYLPYCHHHARRVYGVKVANSTIPNGGKGLFALKQIHRNENIVPYTGEVIDDAQNDRRYGSNRRDLAPYAYKLEPNYIIDSCCKRSLASYANSPKGTRRSTNSKLIGRRDTGVFLRATKNIHGRNDHPVELLTSYGPNYFPRGRRAANGRYPKYQTKKSKLYVPRGARRGTRRRSSS
jgi:hypothetical protein